MSDKPVVFIIDIDGTLIGDIRPQIMLYEIHQAIKKVDKKVNIMNMNDFKYKLKDGGIVRPYFAKFVRNVREAIPNAEFFVYTASENNWAKFLVPQIEKATGIKFNRPIFTRSDCVYDKSSDLRKSLCNITPCLLRALRKRYGQIRKEDLTNRLLVIDNTRGVFDEHDRKFVVHCPTYDYKNPENIMTSITQSVFDRYQSIIISTLGQFLNMNHVANYMEFQHVFYTYYVSLLSKLHRFNQEQSRDKFFLQLLNIIIHKRIKQFTPSTIAYLERKIKQKSHSVDV